LNLHLKEGLGKYVLVSRYFLREFEIREGLLLWIRVCRNSERWRLRF